ncbi:OPT2 [Candida jiufengensis]|uniref:OPT2 n=1 Tax=Candida jiufengensis TaxID=497108 RepID=UPI0022256273|nr:OPT2 [Candida jiufengensis]KAI5950838.1 OPT2 [Candida jiufengensis]
MSTEKGHLELNNVTSVGSHLQADDHELNINAVLSNPLSIGEVGTTLTNAQKDFVLKRLHFDALESFDQLPPECTFIFEKIEQMSTEEGLEILKEALKEHEYDVNIPDHDLELWKALIDYKSQGKVNFPPSYDEKHQSDNSIDLKGHPVKVSTLSDSSEFIDSSVNDPSTGQVEIVDWALQVKLEAVLLAYWSPYPEVRAVTFPFDDPTIPVETIRVYIIGIVWTAIGAVINQFFTERQPSISLAVSVVQVFLYPSGKLCEWILPNYNFKLGKFSFNLNPGPYSYKEQVLATIFCSVSGGGTSYVSYNLLMQKSEVFYGNTWVDFGYEVLLILSTNFLGIGLAGIMRKIAVYPVQAIWPLILPNLALNKTLMTPSKKENINGWKISGYNFFFVCFFGMFLYFWIPNYLFGALSYFNWMTWISPNNLNLAVVTGSIGGLGLNPIPSFDWNILNSNEALNLPFYNQTNMIVGMFIGFFAILGIWYSNYKWTGFMPINSNALFTNTGERYHVTEVVNSDSLFDNEKYQQVGPPFYTAANLVVYGAFFAIYPFHFVYEFILQYKQMKHAMIQMWKTIKNYKLSTYDGFNDPHSVMMRAYKEVPEWAYLIVLVISLVLAIICVKVYPAQTPVWGIFFALGINFVFLVPLTTVAARTGFAFGLNVLVELIVGYAIPGNGLALAFIKALGYNIDGQAQNFVNDLKQGHYAKVPPRAMFRCQLLSIFIASFIQLGILNFQITGIKDYCDPLNRQKFTCANTRTFYSASVLWGVIGPKKVFDHLYPVLRWCFLIGFLLAFPCAALKKYGPRKLVKSFEPSIIIGGFLNFAPYNLSYYIGGVYLSLAFMVYIKRKYQAWWQKYNYLLSTGFAGGLAFSSIIIFFAVQYHDKSISWWGNNVSYNGMDSMIYTVGRLNATLQAPDGYFGPRFGHFP